MRTTPRHQAPETRPAKTRRALEFLGLGVTLVSVFLIVPVPPLLGGSVSHVSAPAPLGLPPASSSSPPKNPFHTSQPPSGGQAWAASEEPPRSPTSSPRRTVTPVHFPTRTEVEALLRCRARAWRARSTAALGSCLAENSQALVDDTKRLKEAAARGLTYTGLAYTVEKVQRISLEAGRPTARVTVRQEAYRMWRGSRSRAVPTTRQKVRLTFAGGPHTWKLASWNSA